MFRSKFKYKLLQTAGLTASVLIISACGGGSNSSAVVTPPLSSGVTNPPPVTKVLEIDNTKMAANFLSKVSFGGTLSDIEASVGKDASSLLNVEFEKSPTLYLPSLRAKFEAENDLPDRAHLTDFWNAMVEADDQLRQRMVFALSQIVVVSDKSMGDEELSMAMYMDALSNNAFGNYRQLLKDVTYTPAMAEYLTYLRNRKGDDSTGQMPDENYAREFLQLFTIGLVELNMDGTPKLDSEGKPIEIFNNDDIVGLARVFTGLSHKGEKFWRRDPDGHYSKLIMWPDFHSDKEKSFLGKTISASTSGDEAIDQAINHIFEHPNVAPFISRQLIQRFTSSHPKPDYVQRVATAFETGQFVSVDNVRFGTGERGDLKATLAAILLDQQFYDDVAPGSNDGKIREPVLRFVHFARAFDMGNVMANNERWLLYNSNKNTRLGQQPFHSPSVFNFYRPGFVAPGTETGAQNLTAPEFQTVNEASVIGFANFMMEFIYNSSPRRDDTIDTFAPNYDAEFALADNPLELVQRLDKILTSERMSQVTKDRIIETLNEIEIRVDSETDDKLTRVSVAIFMAVTSPAFAIDL